MTAPDFAPGAVLLQRYEIVRRIGAGGAGLVFQVRDRALDDQPLALKIISADLSDENDPNFASRFRNEVIITRKLTHPNIVRSYDFGELPDGKLFMTMEYVPGCTLEHFIRNLPAKQRTTEFALVVLRALAEAVGYAHDLGVIHRDLKSANVLIGEDGAIKITDFGLAQMRSFERNLTMTGECVGTPLYMSPEQIRGEKVDRRTDIYSLGIIAYELLTGKTPYQAESWYGLASQIVTGPPPQFENSPSPVPNWYQQFVQRAAAKERGMRFQSTQEMVAFLEDQDTGNSEALPFPKMENRTESEPVGLRVAALLSLAVFLSLVSLGAMSWTWYARQHGSVAQPPATVQSHRENLAPAPAPRPSNVPSTRNEPLWRSAEEPAPAHPRPDVSQPRSPSYQERPRQFLRERRESEGAFPRRRLPFAERGQRVEEMRRSFAHRK